MTINYATMNKLHQLVWICDTFREPTHDIAVTLTLDVGHVIAQADIATLEYAVHLGNLTDNLRIEVKDSAVVLAKLLDNLWRNKTSPNQFLHCAFCYPLCILDIALMTWKLLDEIRIYQTQSKMRRKHTPYWYPIDTGTLHTNLRNMMLLEQFPHFFQLKC